MATSTATTSLAESAHSSSNAVEGSVQPKTHLHRPAQLNMSPTSTFASLNGSASDSGRSPTTAIPSIRSPSSTNEVGTNSAPLLRAHGGTNDTGPVHLNAINGHDTPTPIAPPFTSSNQHRAQYKMHLSNWSESDAQPTPRSDRFLPRDLSGVPYLPSGRNYTFPRTPGHSVSPGFANVQSNHTPIPKSHRHSQSEAELTDRAAILSARDPCFADLSEESYVAVIAAAAKDVQQRLNLHVLSPPTYGSSLPQDCLPDWLPHIEPGEGDTSGTY